MGAIRNVIIILSALVISVVSSVSALDTTITLFGQNFKGGNTGNVPASIEISPNEKFIIRGGWVYDIATGQVLTNGQGLVSIGNGAVWDKFGHVWSTLSTLLAANGVLLTDSNFNQLNVFGMPSFPSNYVWSIAYDRTSNLLVFGTEKGILLANPDSAGNLNNQQVLYNNGQFIGKVLTFYCPCGGGIIAEGGQSNVYRHTNTDGWTTSHPDSLGFVSKSLTLDTSRVPYISTATGVKKYNSVTSQWERVSVVSNEDIFSMMIDRNNFLWFQGTRHFGRKNLATGVVDVVPLSAVPWLGDSANFATFSQTPDSLPLFGGIKKFMFGIPPSAVLPIAPKFSVAGHYKVVGFSDLLGRVRKVVNNNPSSFYRSCAPGLYIEMRLQDGSNNVNRGTLVIPIR